MKLHGLRERVLKEGLVRSCCNYIIALLYLQHEASSIAQRILERLTSPGLKREVGDDQNEGTQSEPAFTNFPVTPFLSNGVSVNSPVQEFFSVRIKLKS